MTLIELLIAISIMAMVVGTLGALARGVQEGYTYTEGHGAATQHARVVLERILATVREATTSPEFPGVLVVSEEEGGWEFSDTLVIWHPDGAPADPDGLPRYDELVIYCPGPSLANRLVEMTIPGDTRPVPPPENTSQWEAEIEAIKSGSRRRTVMLTDLLRTGRVEGGALDSRRGAAQFGVRLRPSQQEWKQYEDGVIDWDDLAWVQGIYGSQTGLRQAWVRVELQLMPGDQAAAADSASTTPVPVLGSAALYYELAR
jgi:hypothetical protein